MNLSRTQIDILSHRLDSGCVADVLADTEELGIGFAEAETAVAAIQRHVASGQLPLEDLSFAELEVVIDCLEGSTFFADEGDAIVLGQTSRGRQLERHKAANELEREVSLVASRQVRCTRE